ncbi:substrate-binding domain-containing protein [Paraburkholderia sp. SEWSISQ10-3 4]|jgi:LacI family transcriptional regulator|uniref:substrate-binding domain-containing protein n=1 Tax=Paraburkholderia TaxID=1822464 RepID=UPI00190B41F4|nr:MULTISPECIES: substrate-binding domain-containing protein [Paraburkholderia]MBK3840230.1 LacI family DNA-binding transcriptional regulator [Paraburkholderia aspalathi]MCX4137709.1 substrate-binding domain-containing protein [Paraburkholderia aspalathi]MDN7170400.1 substrate-binding domain-containing protein [Paraburkholderia sp. SEWSISQ10-3 4]MDQ6500039.1 substrate-binding domain-containing protein [Paraburkholderia aspalathi]CAE6779034.1 HTH-type transcriptional regulator RafR [Paraburkhol
MNIQELAAHLQLSVSTVSKAINGKSDVNAKTRQRVLDAAAQFGFSADAAARRLRTQTSDLIAFVLSAPQAHFAHPFFLNMLMGIDENLEHSRYQLVVSSARSAEHEMQVLKRLVEVQKVDGVLFGRTLRQDPRIAYLLERKVPFVAFGRSETPGEFAYLDIDHTVVGREGCARCVTLGHRRIGLVNAPNTLMFSHHQRLGYEGALRAASIPFDETLYIEADMTEEGGLAAARQMLEADDPPTAIISGHDLVAVGIYRAITERGLVPGRDIAVIGGDDHPFGTLLSPALTTFSAETLKAGKRMSEMLLAQLDGTPVNELQEVWSPDFIPRSSDGSPRLSTEKRGRAAARR